MGKVIDSLVEATYRARRGEPMDMILPPLTWANLRSEAEAGGMLVFHADKQPATFMGMPVEIDPSIPADEVHFRQPPSPSNRRGRVDVLKLA